MHVTYPGPFDEVEVPAARAAVKRGASVEVDDALGARLVAQGWEHEEVVTGTVGAVKDWVGADPDRARSALASERAAEKPRRSLVEWLDGVINTGDEPTSKES